MFFVICRNWDLNEQNEMKKWVARFFKKISTRMKIYQDKKPHKYRIYVNPESRPQNLHKPHYKFIKSSTFWYKIMQVHLTSYLILSVLSFFFFKLLGLILEIL